MLCGKGRSDLASCVKRHSLHWSPALPFRKRAAQHIPFFNAKELALPSFRVFKVNSTPHHNEKKPVPSSLVPSSAISLPFSPQASFFGGASKPSIFLALQTKAALPLISPRKTGCGAKNKDLSVETDKHGREGGREQEWKRAWGHRAMKQDRAWPW